MNLREYKKAFNQLKVGEYFYINALNVSEKVIDYLKEAINEYSKKSAYA